MGKDEGFIADMLAILTRAGTRACISASGDEELRQALTCVTKVAVADALQDERFMSAFRAAICESMRDGNIYRSAASGIVGAINPWARKAPAAASAATTSSG